MGNLFCSGIDLIYDTQMVRVRTEGFLSQSFLIQRGVRQGCPLSLLLFNLVTEVLARVIRNNILIQGIETQFGIHKISLYADDIVVFFAESGKSTDK